MTGRHTRLVVLTVLAVAVARTPSDALQETPTLQQITEMHKVIWNLNDVDKQVENKEDGENPIPPPKQGKPPVMA